MLKRMVGAVDGLFACSSYVAEPLLALNPSTPVRVVYNPVDVDRFGPSTVSREEARSRLGLGQTTAVLVMVAQIILFFVNMSYLTVAIQNQIATQAPGRPVPPAGVLVGFFAGFRRLGKPTTGTKSQRVELPLDAETGTGTPLRLADHVPKPGRSSRRC